MTARLRQLLDHFLPSAVLPTVADPTPATAEYSHNHNYHTLSPTYFLPRAAAIEPKVRLPSVRSRGRESDPTSNILLRFLKDSSRVPHELIFILGGPLYNVL